MRSSHLPGNGLPRIHSLIDRLRSESRGSVTVEFAMIVPAMLMLLSIVVFAGQGFEIQRKVTLTMRTLTDLAAQQTNIGTSSTTYTYTQILNAASLVMTPYNSTGLSMVLSEVSTSGNGTGTVVWSQATSDTTALTTGASVSIPSNLTTSSYMIVGTVSYTYNPLNIFFSVGGIPLSNSIAMAPRASTGSVACCN
jgi:Flp pilus assembly protein TadG